MDSTVADWYKDAIIYQLHIKAFSDANNDGTGDFAGLLDKLDYVQQLGVTAIWLLPFYPSPFRDDGYDISDYTEVHGSYGSLDDFRRFVDAAHARGIRVITELVINHTSDTHPWFQRARRAPVGSPERDFYVWSDNEERYQGTRIIFLDSETSNWAWDPIAKAYYWHRFYSHQPDLNFDNPLVFDEVVRALRFWLDIGVDGLRLDAVPYLCEREETNNENLPETHDVLRRIRHEIDTRYPDRMLLAEANQWPEDTRPYFGEGDECHMAFHFPLMPRMYMALAQEDRHPITDIVRQTPDIPDNCQWALFLRNHDELTLEMVTDEERDYLWKTYAVDPRARINLGIRRRLAPLMDNDRRKIELMNMLLLSLPGTPVLYYGDEIGMGDNYYLGDRDGVRTPMQWSIDRNAGFSRADPQRLYLPVLMDPIYGHQAVNVEKQQSDPSSLLNWTRRMIGVRKTHRAFGRGALTFLYPNNRSVLAFLRESEGEAILCVANLSRSAQAVQLDLAAHKGAVPVELGGGSAFPPVTEAAYVLTLPAYGYFWFLLAQETELPRWYVPPPEALPDLMTLVMADGWDSLLASREGLHLERSVLTKYLPRQRWFGAKDERISSVRVAPIATLSPEGRDSLLATAVVSFAGGGAEEYALPLAVEWQAAAGESTGLRSHALAPYTLARIRRGSRVGLIVDGGHDESFVRALSAKLKAGRPLAANGGSLRFDVSEALRQTELGDVKIVTGDQSNALALLGDSVLLKLYRRIEGGPQPEIEMLRFLSDEAGFENAPKYLGSVEYVPDDGAPKALACAVEYVANQGDAWTVVTGALERMLEEYGLTLGADALPPFAFPLDAGGMLGRRTAELHLALSRETQNEAFRAEPVEREDIERWVLDTRVEAERTFEALARAQRTELAEGTRACIELLLSRRSQIDALLARAETLSPSGAKIRHHGDYHLGQLLVVKDDLVIVDFEGEPTRSLADRRRKTSPLRDLAGMVRSLDYAAWSALDRVALRGLNPAEDTQALAFAWRDRAIEECVMAYKDVARGAAFYPADDRAEDDLLGLFLLRKALYEVQYEIGSRPAWLTIPVRGIIALADRLAGEA
ncbi:MAG: maltose alpha-D-glucosyltransferase [Hyphomicrobium sp.]